MKSNQELPQVPEVPQGLELPHVFISSDTERGIMLEKARHPGVECIIQMPGRRTGNAFYYDWVADSGMNATYQYAMCEKDHDYCDHLSTRIAEYYSFPPEELVVAQIHCHPPNCKEFSHGDGPANTKLAKQYGGVTNGLMWVDPEFHMQFWYIDENGNATPIDYTVDDEAVARAMPKKSIAQLKKMIENNEALFIAERKAFWPAGVPSRNAGPEREDKKNFFVKLSELCGRMEKGKGDEADED